MKKILRYSLIICFIVLFNLLISPKVKANNIERINVDVYIDSFGNADVTETWDVSTNTGTECYKSFSNLDNSNIYNFSVIDNKIGQYTTIDLWDVNASFTEKSSKCGIKRDSSGIELCWGITEYGNNTYTLKYQISNLVTQYTDTQGIYFNFLKLNHPVGNAIVTIHSDIGFNLNNARIWSFGYTGTIDFVENCIVMDSKGALNSNQYMVGLVRFENNFFNTNNNSIKSFDDIYDSAMSTVNKKIDLGVTDKIENESLRKASMILIPVGVGLLGLYLVYAVFHIGKGIISAYIKCIKMNPISTIVITLLNILLFYKSIIIGLIGIIISARIMDIIHTITIKKKIKQLDEKFPTLPNATHISYSLGTVDKYRDIPFEKNIWCAAAAADFYTDFIYNDTFLIGAILLKWVKNNNIEIAENKNGILDIKNSNYSVLFKSQEGLSSMELRLWNILTSAAGANNILEPNELKAWCKKHFREMMKWCKDSRYYQQDEALKLGYLENRKSISQSFVEESKKLKGLKNFLLDYSLMPERKHIEVHIWEDYLIFAEILGIADKVEQEFKELYPDLKLVTKLYSADCIAATEDISQIAISATEWGINDERYYLSTVGFSHSSSSHDYSGTDRDSGGGGSSYDSGGDSAGGSSGGGFR